MSDIMRYDVLVHEALMGVLRKVLAEIETAGLPGDHHIYITFTTQFEGVSISQRLRSRYPAEMTIVLQHQFWDLRSFETGFEVSLSFGGVTERLVIPYRAVRGFFDPSVHFALEFSRDDAGARAVNRTGQTGEEAGAAGRADAPGQAGHTDPAIQAQDEEMAEQAQDMPRIGAQATHAGGTNTPGTAPPDTENMPAPMPSAITDPHTQGQSSKTHQARHGTRSGTRPGTRKDKTGKRAGEPAGDSSHHTSSDAPSAGADVVKLDTFRKGR